MIRLIINGYYRTGSTVLFRIVKESNKNMLVVYEPLQPEMFYSLIVGRKGEENELHGYPVFDSNFELYQLNPNLRKLHEKIKLSYFFFNKFLIRYLDEINKIKKATILQTNTLHFLLSPLCKRYNCRFIHIIRNPLDEWHSFNNPTLLGKIEKERKFQKIKRFFSNITKEGYTKAIIYLPYLIRMKKYLKYLGKMGPFHLEMEFKELCKKFKINEKIGKDKFDGFILLWTFINYYAIKQTNLKKEKIGKIIWYEDLLDDPRKKLRELQNFSKINFKTGIVNLNKSSLFKFNSSDVEEFWKRCKRMGIENKVLEIFNTTKNEKLSKRYDIKAIKISLS